MTSLKTRQKHIRIADRSEYGWAAVEGYVEDELADGEDDKKRIQRVDFRAGKKLKSVKGAKNKKGSGPNLSPAKNLSILVPRLGEGLPVMGPWRSIAYNRRCLDLLVASKQAEACSSLALVLCVENMVICVSLAPCCLAQLTNEHTDIY